MSFKTYLEWDPHTFAKYRDLLGPKNVQPKEVPEWVKEEINYWNMERKIKDSTGWQVVDPINYHGIDDQRLVLYNNKVYTYMKDCIHRTILLWMILNRGANISKEEVDSWWRNPLPTNFLCMQQIDNDKIYLSESYEMYDDDILEHIDKFRNMFSGLEKAGYEIIERPSSEAFYDSEFKDEF